jgi:hypothetical protein
LVGSGFAFGRTEGDLVHPVSLYFLLCLDLLMICKNSLLFHLMVMVILRYRYAITIELMFAGINTFLVRLRLILAGALRGLK